MNVCIAKTETSGVITGMAGLFASFVAGMACIGPLLGIAMGITGFGWLSGFSYLTVPASITSMVLLAAALFMYMKRKSCCASKRRHYLNRALLITASLFVVGINVFEYLIFPDLL